MTLRESLGNDSRLPSVKKSITRNFLYEHSTLEKMILYFCHLDLGFDNKKLRTMLGKLIGVRGDLVHNLNSKSLSKTPLLLAYLQWITEDVIFRILGFDKNMQNKLLLNQCNLGTEL